MILLHHWKFFSKSGSDLNLEKIPKIFVSIKNTLGKNAFLLPITDNSGNLVHIEIIEPGIGFKEGGQTNLDIIDINGTIYNIPYSAITFDNVTGGFVSIDVTGAPTGSFTYPSFTYEGNVFFDRISSGLIENQHLFILEEVFNTTDDKKDYTFPRGSNTDNIVLKWTDEDTIQQDKDALFMFDVDHTSANIPLIKRIDSTTFSLSEDTDDTINNNYIRALESEHIDTNTIQVNLGLSYPSEGIFERKLELWDNSLSTPALLAEIYLRGEVIPEDERFVTILTNLGQEINKEEEFIFRDSDINEDLPNYDLLNRKRKEFILEYSNIVPYIGSYKAIFNILNWLGYNDLRLKEYWLNVDENAPNFGKYKPLEIPFDVKRRNKSLLSNEILPSNVYKKTHLFALYYDINHESGELDEFGIPKTDDAFMFTNEEVLIKLHSLKAYLKKKFLPLNAKIIDIVGEGIYFERYSVNSWSDGTTIFDITNEIDVKFEAYPQKTVLTDLRKFENYDYFKPAILKTYYNSDRKLGISIVDPGYGYVGDVELALFGGVVDDTNITPVYTVNIVNGSIDSITQDIPSSTYSLLPLASIEPNSTNPDKDSTLVIDIRNRILGSFDGSDTINLADSMSTPVGAPITLKTSTFGDNTGIYYELEWKVYGPKGYVHSKRGPIKDLEEYSIFAPYIGDYTVELVLYDTNNSRINQVKQNCFNVSAPQITFTAFGQYTQGLTTWNELNIPWDIANFSWLDPTINLTKWDDLDLSWDALDMATYINQDINIFPAKVPYEVLRLSEADRFFGNITNIDYNSKELTILGASDRPKLSVNDFIYLRRNDNTYRVQVTDINDDYDKFTVSNLPSGITNKWEVLREIGQTVLLKGDVIKNEYNLSGLKVGDWITVRGRQQVPQIKGIEIVNKIVDSSNIIGIELPTDYSSTFRIGEKCKIYKKRTFLMYSDSDISNYSDKFYIDGNKILIYNPSFDIISELIPGYHIITIKDANYSQRFLVNNINITNDTTDYNLTVTPLDGDISLVTDGSSTLEYEYWDFTAVINGVNSTQVTLNFNDWPENINFNNVNNDWYFDYGIMSGDWSMEVIKIGIESGNTLVTVDDINSELWRSSSSFVVDWRPFDEDYAENRFGTNILNWKNFDEITWDEMKSFVWDMLEYNGYSYTGFKITKVNLGGKIQWNEEPSFEFTTIIPSITDDLDKLTQAVDELNKTDNSGLSRFHYSLVTENSVTYISAVAKDPGGKNLGQIKFENVEGEYIEPTLSHTYPLNNTTNPLWLNGTYGPANKPALWSTPLRTYLELGIEPATGYPGNPGWYPAKNLRKIYSTSLEEDPIKWLVIDDDASTYTYRKALADARRLPYLHSLTGALNWYETFVSPRNIEVPSYTVVFFNADGCKVPGKKEYLWRIYKHNTEEILIECIKPYLIWLFSEEGEYDIELQITDVNYNTTNRIRKGFVKVYSPNNTEIKYIM